MNEIASSLSDVEKRAKRFFARDTIRMVEFHNAVYNKLAEVGSVYAIGGVVRDLAFFGAENRPISDIDLVVSGTPRDLDQLALQFGAVRNRFGGYGLKSGGLRVDFWALRRTWAHVNKYTNINKAEDLVKSTFFDWDAVIFDIGKGKIYAGDEYINKMRRRIIDINLLENPSPHGSLVRALRRLVMFDLRPGKRLQWFIKDGMRTHSWESIVRAESGAYHTSHLSQFVCKKDFEYRFLVDRTLSVSGVQDRRQLQLPF